MSVVFLGHSIVRLANSDIGEKWVIEHAAYVNFSLESLCRNRRHRLYLLFEPW